MAGMATLPTFTNASTLSSWIWLNNCPNALVTTTTTGTNLSLPVFSQTSTSTTWQYWAASPQTYTITGLNDIQWAYLNDRLEAKMQVFTAPQPSAEQQEIWRRQELRRSAIMRRRTRQRAAADTLAENLLLACLSPAQARDHLEHGWFDVVSSHDRTFRIFTRTSPWGDRNPGQSGNVALLNAEGKQEARYCVHPPDNLPHADAWLAQKLALEADEDTVMAVANLPWYSPRHQDIRPAARERMRLIRTAA